MTTQNDGSDPVAVLYDRAIGDLFIIQDLDRVSRMTIPAFPEERGPQAKECWGYFESMIDSYRCALNRFDESARQDRKTREDEKQAVELIFRTRATQRRRPFIEEAKAYLDKSRKLYRYLLEGLAPVTGKRTIKAYHRKVDDWRALWDKYSFTFEEIQAIPTLIDALQTEFALIDKDRKPTFTEFQQNTPKESGKPKTRGCPGAKPKAWSDLEKDVYKLKQKGKTPLEIRDALKAKHQGLTRKDVVSTIGKLEKRIKRGNGPE